MHYMTKKDLIDFEMMLADKYDDGQYPYLVHLSGGNEDQLIDIFKDVQPGDYVFSTHRSHYHYLLSGGDPNFLEKLVARGKSMFVFDRRINFYSSSILAATAGIAAGVALALKRKRSNKRVWCFIGDGAEDEGHFFEAARYVDGWDLPCTFIVEDNNRSVNSDKIERWGTDIDYTNFQCVKRYYYTPTWPHGGTGTAGWLKFKNEQRMEQLPHKKILNLCKYSMHSTSYKDAVKISMDALAADGVVFIGYNVKHGCAYGALFGVPDSQKIETPVAENLMAGLAMGMSLEGFRPVLFFERHDFIYNALDAIVNQMDRVEIISDGQYKFPVIIKAVAGGTKPFYAGVTHTSNLFKLFDQMFSFPTLEPNTAEEVISAYRAAFFHNGPVLISERKELYE